MAITIEHPETPSSSPRKRAAKPNDHPDASPRKKAAASNKIPIPTTIDEASPEDKMLLRMRDEGHSWAEIREAWENMTGTKVSTGKYLNVRYARIRANLTVVDEADVPRLMEAKKAIETEFEREKYGRIAKAIADAGGKGYEAAVVQKKIKELAKNGAFDGLA